MKLFKVIKKKYLDFFFLSPFKMGNLLLCYCIRVAIVVIYSYTNYSLNTSLGKFVKTQNVFLRGNIMFDKVKIKDFTVVTQCSCHFKFCLYQLREKRHFLI